MIAAVADLLRTRSTLGGQSGAELTAVITRGSDADAAAGHADWAACSPAVAPAASEGAARRRKVSQPSGRIDTGRGLRVLIKVGSALLPLLRLQTLHAHIACVLAHMHVLQ